MSPKKLLSKQQSKKTINLLNITNFGQKSLEEVTAKLDELGSSLRSSVDSDGGD